MPAVRIGLVSLGYQKTGANLNYAMSKTVDLPFEATLNKVTEELKKEGFGVLTTIDVKETLKKKLDVDFKRYVILGACNPQFAYKALQADEEIGLLLPCNVVLSDSEGKTNVSIFDPMIMTRIVGNETIQTLATEIRSRLERVLDGV